MGKKKENAYTAFSFLKEKNY